jgi:hypothetical protein
MTRDPPQTTRDPHPTIYAPDSQHMTRDPNRLPQTYVHPTTQDPRRMTRDPQQTTPDPHRLRQTHNPSGGIG